MKLLLLAALLISSAVRAEGFLDGKGRQVVIEGKPNRIISGSLASDEILLDILSRTRGTNRLIAVSTMAFDARYSNVWEHPALRLIKSRFGGELESLVAQKPDLVILASFNRPEYVKSLESAHVRVFVLDDFFSLEGIAKNIETIGKIICESPAASELKREFELSLSRYRERKILKPRPTVLNFFSEGSEDQLLGEMTTFDEIVTLAGASNLAKAEKLKLWTKLSLERLVTLDPDFVVATGEEKDRSEIQKLLLSRAGWRDKKAVKSGRIVLVPNRELMAVSHHVTKAIDRLASAFENRR